MEKQKITQQIKCNQISLPVKKKNSNVIRKETSPCIRVEGSYTAEAVVAIPFFTAFMVVLLFFFRVLMVQQTVEHALMETGREAAVLAYEEQQGRNVVGIPAAELLFLKNLNQDEATENLVQGGALGISLVRSDFSKEYVELTADYSLRLPIGLFGKQKISVTQRVKCRKWTGETNANSQENEELVYITPTGAAYHRNRNCSYLKLSVKPVQGSSIDEYRNADGGKYYSCSSCMKNDKSYAVIYITEYGNRYHGNLNCSRLKRTIIAVRLSEVGERHACGKCG